MTETPPPATALFVAIGYAFNDLDEADAVALVESAHPHLSETEIRRANRASAEALLALVRLMESGDSVQLGVVMTGLSPVIEWVQRKRETGNDGKRIDRVSGNA